MAWQIGVITGLSDAGIDLRHADKIIGTSAGSVIAAQIASGVPLHDLFERQVKPEQHFEVPPVDVNALRIAVRDAREAGGTPAEILKRMGAIAMRTSETSAAERRAEIASRLPVERWPEQRIEIVAVDCETGERRVFDRDSGVSLLDAVGASCAVPGIWPPVLIQQHRYMDGGIHSNANADLAADCDEVLILALRARVPSMAVVPLESAVEQLRAGGAHVEIIMPDDTSEAAFASVGHNVLDPAVREPAARAGRRQARDVVAILERWAGRGKWICVFRGVDGSVSY
jgi:NTE family protein